MSYGNQNVQHGQPQYAGYGMPPQGYGMPPQNIVSGGQQNWNAPPPMQQAPGFHAMNQPQPQYPQQSPQQNWQPQQQPQQNWQQPPQAAAINVAGKPRWIADAIESVARGMMPYHNHVEYIGQVMPSKGMDNGWNLKQTANGSTKLTCQVKLIKTYNHQGITKVSNTYMRFAIFGQRANELSQQLCVGRVVAFRGENRSNAFPDKVTGKMVYLWEVVLDGKDPQALEVLGDLPYVDDRQQNAPQNQQAWGQQPQYPQQAPQQNWQQPPQAAPQPQMGQPQPPNWGQRQHPQPQLQQNWQQPQMGQPQQAAPQPQYAQQAPQQAPQQNWQQPPQGVQPQQGQTPQYQPQSQPNAWQGGAPGGQAGQLPPPVDLNDIPF